MQVRRADLEIFRLSPELEDRLALVVFPSRVVLYLVLEGPRGWAGQSLYQVGMDWNLTQPHQAVNWSCRVDRDRQEAEIPR